MDDSSSSDESFSEYAEETTSIEHEDDIDEDSQLGTAMAMRLYRYAQALLRGQTNNLNTDGVRVVLRNGRLILLGDDIDSDSEDSDMSQEQIQQLRQQFEQEIRLRAQKLRQSDLSQLLPPATPFAQRLRQIQTTGQCNSYDLKLSFIPSYDHGPFSLNRTSVFCGMFSKDGSRYVTASKDECIRVYTTQDIEDWYQAPHSDSQPDVSLAAPEPFQTISARDIGWSIIDMDFSPNQRSVIYSSWSPYVHLCRIRPDSTLDEQIDEEGFETQPHEALLVGTSHASRFCGFSVQFSPDSREILVGASDQSLYIFDLQKKRRILNFEAHEDDINAVEYASTSDSNIFFSGSDDGTCKVWDRRSFRFGSYQPVATFVGHTAGITHVNSRGDGRYFISNGKDQCIKLWDVRCIKNTSQQNIPHLVNMSWDYRYEECPSRFAYQIHPLDQSVMTYSGHRVLRTLIRAYFSPVESTGQRYIYCGSFDGTIFIYDVLTGQVLERIMAHSDVVRDVSWHPHLPIIYSTSFDGMTKKLSSPNGK